MNMVRKHKNILMAKNNQQQCTSQVPSLHGRTKTIDQQLLERMRSKGKQEEWLNEIK